jgi:type IV secretory pathway component VirB8
MTVTRHGEDTEAQKEGSKLSYLKSPIVIVTSDFWNPDVSAVELLHGPINFKVTRV